MASCKISSKTRDLIHSKLCDIGIKSVTIFGVTEINHYSWSNKVLLYRFFGMQIDKSNVGVYSVPEMGSLFYGRDKEIRYVDNLIKNEHKLTLIISGPQGVGKSRLASHIARINMSVWDNVLWFSAENSQSFYSDLDINLSLLNISVNASDASSLKLAKFRSWINVNTRSCIILDNADDQNVLDRILLWGCSCSIIITTNNRNVKTLESCKELEVVPFDRFNSYEFVKNIIENSGTSKIDEGLLTTSILDKSSGLPVELVKIAALIEDTSGDLSLLKELLIQDEEPAVTNSVLRCFIVTKSQNELSANLLLMMTSFTPNEIPIDLIIMCATNLVPGIRKVEINKALKSLERLRLVEKAEQNTHVVYIIHRLTRSVLLNQDDLQRDLLSCSAVAVKSSLDWLEKKHSV